MKKKKIGAIKKKKSSFFKAINQFIHLLLQSRGSIISTKRGPLKIAEKTRE